MQTPLKKPQGQQPRGDTRSHWEKMDVIAPIYRLAGEGLSDHAIALKLNLTENTVYGCIGYLLRRLKCRTRAELVLYASPKPHESWNLRTFPTMLISKVRRWRQRQLASSFLAK
jgi:regulatory LuxR family protein